VDLRWGVPDEAKAEGKVLPLSLAEIERCRAYFIDLLGERMDGVPEEIPPDLLNAQKWLQGETASPYSGAGSRDDGFRTDFPFQPPLRGRAGFSLRVRH